MAVVASSRLVDPPLMTFSDLLCRIPNHPAREWTFGKPLEKIIDFLKIQT